MIGTMMMKMNVNKNIARISTWCKKIPSMILPTTKTTLRTHLATNT
jgi:hypothetical protein